MSDLSLRDLPILEGRWAADVGDYVSALAWSADGQTLAVAAANGPVAVFDGVTGRVRQRLAGHAFGTLALGWSADGRCLASAGQDGKVRLWDPLTGDSPSAELDGGAAWVEKLAWSPSAPLLATAAGKRLRLWTADGQLKQDYAPQANTFSDLAWQRDGRTLVTSGYGAVRCWRADSAESVRTYEWKNPLLALAVRPNGKHIVVGCHDATLHFWNTRNGKDLYMAGYETKVRELSWSADSRYLASGGGQAIVTWDFSGTGPEGSQPGFLRIHLQPISALAFQHKGYVLASGGQDGLTFVVNAQGNQVRAVVFEDGPVGALAWQPGDKLLAVGYGSGHVAVYRGVQ